MIDQSLGFDDLHPIVREYMTINYSMISYLYVISLEVITNMFEGLDSGHDKAAVPWGQIALQQQDFIEDQFLPFKFEVRRHPSKMNKGQVIRLLEYWHKRQHNSRVAVPFRFKGYRGSRTGEIVVCDRKRKEKMGNNKKGGNAGPLKIVTKSTNRKDDTPEGEIAEDRRPASDSDPDADSGNDSDDESDSSDKLPLTQPSTSKGQGKIRTAKKQKDDETGLSEEDTDSEKQKQVKRAADARKKKLDMAREKAMEVERRKMMAMKNKKIQAEKKDKEEGDNGESRDILTGSKRKRRSEDDRSERLDENEGKKNVKRMKETSTTREIVTRSRGREEITGQRKSKRGNK